MNYSNVRSALGLETPVDKIVFGTDGEINYIKAIQTYFPDSQHILCTRHLEENAIRNFGKNVNTSEKVKNSLIAAIFGTSGLLSSNSIVSYTERESEILEEFGHVGGSYLKDKLLPTLKGKIFLPSQKNENIPPNWKNNNCESMNHKIKLLGDWKVSKTPELIDRLHEIQVSQVIEIRGALHGRGSLELAERARHLRISHALWLELGGTCKLRNGKKTKRNEKKRKEKKRKENKEKSNEKKRKKTKRKKTKTK